MSPNSCFFPPLDTFSPPYTCALTCRECMCDCGHIYLNTVLHTLLPNWVISPREGRGHFSVELQLCRCVQTVCVYMWWVGVYVCVFWLCRALGNHWNFFSLIQLNLIWLYIQLLQGRRGGVWVLPQITTPTKAWFYSSSRQAKQTGRKFEIMNRLGLHGDLNSEGSELWRTGYDPMRRRKSEREISRENNMQG